MFSCFSSRKGNVELPLKSSSYTQQNSDRDTFTKAPKLSKLSDALRKVVQCTKDLGKCCELVSATRSIAPSPQLLPAKRTVQFASGAAASARAEFPFQVHHHFTGGVDSCSQAPSINNLLPQVKDSLSSKQGFLYLFDATTPSPMQRFADYLRNAPALPLRDHCTLIGAYPTPAETASVFSPQWTLQIYDSKLEATFEVPVTEVPLRDMANPANRTEQLMHLKNCMDSHLRSIPNEFKDSPQCPSIMCPQLPRLAQLVTAQEECLGRQYRGELQCRESIDWICAGEALLKTISPELPRFVGEESCDFESFFRRMGIYNIGERSLPHSIAMHDGQAHDGAPIRAYKRHLITSPPPASGSAAPAHPRPVTAVPTPQTNVPIQPPQAAPILPAPQWLEARSQMVAYKEPLEQMQCASQAINSMLQNHVVTPKHVATYLANRKQAMLEQIGMNPAEQKGLMSPDILQPLARGETVQISKANFMGNDADDMCIATEQTHRQSWQKLVNATPAAQGKNWVENSAELNAINHITVTPQSWLAAQRGTEVDDLLMLSNLVLARRTQPHQPAAMTHLNVREHLTEIAQLERRARHSIEQHLDFPIIVRTGTQAGHYHTIVPDKKGNWISLNGDGTQVTGTQPCRAWCPAGELLPSFQHFGVTDLLVPQRT